MATPIEASSSWKGLFGCLGGGILVLALVIGVVQFVVGKNNDNRQRVTNEWLNPYITTLRDNQPATAWEQLTTPEYRQQNTQEAFTANFQLALQRFGKPTGFTIEFLTATHEPGRSYQRVQVRWDWEKGPTFSRTFQLVDVPGTGYRLDGATLGGRGINVIPPEVPTGPW